MSSSTTASIDTDSDNDGKQIAAVDDASSVMELSPTERARLLRKLDRHLLPFVSLLYFLSFL